MKYQIPEPPRSISTTNAIARMIDGLVFRYYWATEGLTEQEFHFRPSPDSMSMLELNYHIYDLAYITNNTFGGNSTYKKEYLTSFLTARQEIIRLYEELSIRLKTMTSDEDLHDFSVNPKSVEGEFPFWYVLNGHIADCLTHIGQLTSWRRIAGNPQPKISVFLGK